ncbi:MAG: twin-arginine translocase subunit TatC [Sulfuriflexus sp.]|nr:twin-arginine translocase subunit TatC [Sulfuriflexus sp.]
MSEESKPSEEPIFMSHLIELRDRLLRSVLVVFVILLPLLFFSAELFTLLTVPIIAVLPAGTKLIAIDVASPFLAPFKLAIFTAIFIAIPYLLYQAWSFIAPGLYKNERKLVVPLLVSSTLLFYAGIAFAYFLVFKLVFGFFFAIAPEVVNVTPDINSYLDFTIKMFFAFGICFEVPIATILLCWTGMTSPDKLAEKRRYFIVGVLIISMLMTPPDIISQLLLGIPMWLLFEAGIFFARRIVPKRDTDESDYDEDEEENSIMPDEAAEAAATTTTVTGAAGHDVPAETSDDEEEFEESYTEPTDEEVEAEFDRIEAEEENDDDSDDDDDGSDPQSLEPEPDKKD